MLAARAFVTLTLVLAAPAAFAAPTQGRYVADFDGATAVLELDVDGRRVHGSLTVEGERGTVRGTQSNGVVKGTIELMGESINIRASQRGGQLVMQIVDEDGMTETVTFRPSAATARRPNKVDRSSASAEIVVNGRRLSTAQVASLSQTYGVTPRAGRYWYDAKSGLYGAEGYAAFGFMRPGHRFGRLTAQASNGRSGVFVNGRQLQQGEWVVLSQLVGAPVQPGRYWLDGRGNAGFEGSGVPLVNLYASAGRAAQRNQQNHGGGDNFWSTRFSAGNSDRGGTRGYVSVPGYGPVGYGF